MTKVIILLALPLLAAHVINVKADALLLLRDISDNKPSNALLDKTEYRQISSLDQPINFSKYSQFETKKLAIGSFVKDEHTHLRGKPKRNLDVQEVTENVKKNFLGYF
mmetsp:Transcript_34707/g.80254  ORF Transcript_34707/g.80254 Transcript_34707/m.80254 type:complete len:108 (-) Transcript_34707:362-685(-)